VWTVTSYPTVCRGTGRDVEAFTGWFGRGSGFDRCDVFSE